MTSDATAVAGTRTALLPGVRAAARLLGGLYAVLAVLHLLVAPADLRVTLAGTAGTTAAVCGVIWVAVRGDRLPAAAAPHVAGALATLCAVNSLLHLALTRDPLQVTNVLLVLVAVGAVVDDGRWCLGVGAGSIAGTAAVAFTSPLDPAWSHFGFGLMSASVLALVLRRVRQSSLASLEGARAVAAQQATYDSLTGLLNRRGLELVGNRALAAARREGRPVALLYVDLDSFKAVNDTLGHAAGDSLLVDVARQLTGAFREADGIARIGGDEFAVLLVGADPQAAALLADRGRSCLSGVTASIGTATASQALSVSLAQLLDEADVAMYSEKRHKAGHVPPQRATTAAVDLADS